MNNFPFKSIRKEQQEYFIIKNQNPNKKFIIAELPTGSGKSGIAITEALNAGNSYLICANKSLQDQYERDFYRENLVSLKGKDNYICQRLTGYTCANGPCTSTSPTAKYVRTECRMKHICPYIEHVENANKAKIFLTNGSLMSTTLHCAIPPMRDKRKLLIFDEVHLLEKFLVDAGSMELNYEYMEKKFAISRFLNSEEINFLKTAELTSGSCTENNKKFIDILKSAINKLHEKEYPAKEETDIKPSKNEIRELLKLFNDSKPKPYLTELNTINDKFNTFEKNENRDWSFEYRPDTKTLIVVPLKVDWVFNQVMLPLADKFLFMSATIIDFKVFCDTLGIKYEDVLPIQINSTFDPKKSPIYIAGNCSTNYKDLQDPDNIAKICNSIRSILAIYPNKKGIIHTGNVKISRFIKEHIKDKRLLVRLDDVTNNIILDKHIKSKNTVLVSSSLQEGVDLKDDLSRFQIIVKLPWLSLADPRTKKLTDQNNKWYSTEMWRRLIQSCGRSTRSSDDSSDTFILDSSFKYNYERSKSYLPQFFKDRLIWK
jgi:Rad3-related DNA helicase